MATASTDKEEIYKPPKTLERYVLQNMDNEGMWVIATVRNSVDKFPTFKARPDDVYTIGFPKSGTTWLNEIVYLLVNNIDFELAKKDKQEQRVPYMEFPKPGIDALASYESPRHLKTHMWFSKLPPDIQEKQCKIIYIIRNPKDVSVSLYHWMQNLTVIDYKDEFSAYIEDFIKGRVMYGPWADHVASFWKNRNNKNLHIVFYEELMKNPKEEITKISHFLDKHYSEDEINKIVNFTTFENMRANDSANFSHLHDVGFAHNKHGMVRKGKIGGWKDDYKNDWSEKVDGLIKESLAPIGLTYSYEENRWIKQ